MTDMNMNRDRTRGAEDPWLHAGLAAGKMAIAFLNEVDAMRKAQREGTAPAADADVRRLLGRFLHADEPAARGVARLVESHADLVHACEELERETAEGRATARVLDAARYEKDIEGLRSELEAANARIRDLEARPVGGAAEMREAAARRVEEREKHIRAECGDCNVTFELRVAARDIRALPLPTPATEPAPAPAAGGYAEGAKAMLEMCVRMLNAKADAANKKIDECREARKYDQAEWWCDRASTFRAMAQQVEALSLPTPSPSTEPDALTLALGRLVKAYPYDADSLQHAASFLTRSGYDAGSLLAALASALHGVESTEPDAVPEKKPGWWCAACGRTLDPREVTYDERHDERTGGCGMSVGYTPTPASADAVPDGHRRVWIRIGGSPDGGTASVWDREPKRIDSTTAIVVVDIPIAPTVRGAVVGGGR